MKTAFALCGAALLGVAPLAYTQDKETEEQFKEAAEAAKKMGANIPTSITITNVQSKKTPVIPISFVSRINKRQPSMTLEFLKLFGMCKYNAFSELGGLVENAKTFNTVSFFC